ncbi:MAG: hypothetical protein DRQ98_11535 [Gammaproteobacteria bacterium]|nr:MAG: hypothetical protein DRQ98_11535 [Gammaproteobacteria bacterium]
MATNQDEGGSPTQQTGVAEVSGPLKGDQSYQILLDREMAREPEEVVEEVEPVVEVPNELPVDVPTEDEESQAEPAEEVEEEPPEEVEEPQPEEEEVLSKSADEEPRIPQKRLNKEVARRKDLEERLQRSQARNAELEATAKTEPTSQPSTLQDTMPDVTSLPALNKAQEEAEDAIDYIEGLMDGQPDAVNDAGDDVYTVDGGAQYTRKDLGGMRTNARRKLRREIPQKRNFLNQRVTAQQQATERHEWLADNTSNDYHQYQAIAASRPWILNSDPAGPLLIGAMVEGLKVMRQRTKDAKKPTPTRKKEVAPHVDTTSAAPKRVVGKDGRRRKREARESKMFSKGKLESTDVKNFFLQRELDRE